MEKKLKALTIAEKLNLIKSFEKSSLSKVAFCKENGIARSTFLGILQSKDKLLSNTGRGKIFYTDSCVPDGTVYHLVHMYCYDIKVYLVVHKKCT